METVLKKPGASEILVATIGIETFLLETLKFLFSDSLKNRFVLTTGQNESACIAQVKSTDDIEIIKQYRNKFPQRPLIVISKLDVNLDRVVSLPLPVTPRKIIEALQQVTDLLSVSPPASATEHNAASAASPEYSNNPKVISDKDGEQYVSTRGDIDLSDTDAMEKVRYSDERFLQGRLKSAYSKGQSLNSNIQIYTPHGVFQYFPRQHMAQVEINTHSLRNLASVPDAVTSIMTEFDNEQMPEPKENKKLVSADVFLWQAAIWASRGRLPVETDIDQKFSLKCWPNFTRWLITPHAMQLTVLWLSGPHSLRETVGIMGIPQSHIFTFYSAVQALELVDLDGASTKKSIVHPVKAPSRLKGMIGKIVDYVKPATGKAA